MFGNGTQAVFVHSLTLRSAQMRSQDHARAMFGCVLDGWNRGADPGVVFDLAVLDGNVEVNADEDAPAAQVEVTDGELCHRRFSIADCRLAKPFHALPHGRATAPFLDFKLAIGNPQ